MKQFPFLAGLVFLLLLVQTGFSSATTDMPTAASGSAVATETTAAATLTTNTTGTPSERSGGSVYFETYPAGATISVDNITIGTSAFTYYFERTGPLAVHIRRKGYEDYSGTVTVEEGKRVVFSVDLKPLPRAVLEEYTPGEVVTTATTIRKSTMVMPTPWPSATESPLDLPVVIGAVAGGIGLLVLGRR